MKPLTAQSQAISSQPGVFATLAWAALYVLIAWALCCAVVWFQDPAFQGPDATNGKFGLLAFNGAPGAVLALLLLALSRKRLLSLWSAGSLLLILYLINGLKLATINTPLLPGDFQFLTHLGGGDTLFSHYLTTGLLTTLGVGLAGIVLLAWRERGWKRLLGLVRAGMLAFVAAAVATMCAGVWPWSGIYPRQDLSNFSLWAPRDTARSNGLVVTLLQYAWSTAVALPAPDMAAARAIVQRHPPWTSSTLPSRESLPDIVVLQSESFFDPARMRGYTPDQVLPHFRQVAAMARHGVAWVPTYGGGTIRTEFEVLTGIALRYFPSVQYPYFSLTRRPLHSLPSELEKLGYHTIAIHPNSGSFWNRTTAFRNLGFQQFDAEDAFQGAKRAGFYVSDDALVEHIIQRLDEAKGPTFLFAISMENHGPYDSYPDPHPRVTASETVPADLDATAAANMRGYLGHIRDADASLGRLVDALRARHHRTLLLFYGDHLPALPKAFGEDGFDDQAQPWQQPVPFVLLDTADTASSPEIETASFYLPALLLRVAGIDDHGYFNLLEQIRRGDKPARDWTPAEDDGLRSIMQLRERRQFDNLMKNQRPS